MVDSTPPVDEETSEPVSVESIESIFIPAGDYVTVGQVAQHADVTEDTIREWIEAGRLPALKVSDLGYIIDKKDYSEFS